MDSRKQKRPLHLLNWYGHTCLLSCTLDVITFWSKKRTFACYTHRSVEAMFDRFFFYSRSKTVSIISNKIWSMASCFLRSYRIVFKNIACWCNFAFAVPIFVIEVFIVTSVEISKYVLVRDSSIISIDNILTVYH